MSKRDEYKAAYELLDQRLLKGEITDEQYRLWKKKLAAEEPRGPWFYVIAVAVVVVIIAAVSTWNTLINAPNRSQPVADPAAAAISACHVAVKAQLKSPTSAKFSGETAAASGTTWKVRGNVDADNSFGASLRYTYQCNVEGTVAVVAYLGK